MQCPSCLLRYNITKRRPNIISCGHTICLSCLRTSTKCIICNQLIDPNRNEIINYSLMEILEKDSRQIDKYVKVCFVGSSMVGKTSLIKRMLINQFFPETVTTIGYDFSFADRIVDNLLVRYQLWDSAGQQKYRAISPIHYKNADIVAIVYDTCQAQSDNKLSYWLQETLINCSQQTKIIIVGNKIDLDSDKSQIQPLDEKTLKQIKDSNYPHIQVSCKTGSGLDLFWQTLDNEFRSKIIQKKKDKVRLQKDIEQVQRKKQKMCKIKSNNLPTKIAIKCKSSNKQSCC